MDLNVKHKTIKYVLKECRRKSLGLRAGQRVFRFDTKSVVHKKEKLIN